MDRCWCGGDVQGLSGQLYCADSKFHDPTATGRPDRVRRLYVAGPMSGYPECNYPAFNDVAEKLRMVGYDVVNPAEFGTGRHYVDFIREDLRLMLDCDGVALLEGWWESTGARNEVQVAGLLKMACRPWQEWVHRTRKELG